MTDARSTRVDGKADTTKEEQAYLFIRDAIQTGRIQPGARLIISELARILGVSDIPVRAALQRLAGQRQVEFKPNAGYRVSAHDPARVYHAVVVLGSLWELAAQLAAARRTEGDLHRMREIHERASYALAKEDVLEFSRCGREFHRAIADAAGNPYLVETTERVTQDGQRATAQLAGPNRMRQSHRDHEMLLEAITAELPGRAAQLARWHVEDINTSVAALWGQQHPDLRT